MSNGFDLENGDYYEMANKLWYALWFQLADKLETFYGESLFTT